MTVYVVEEVVEVAVERALECASDFLFPCHHQKSAGTQEAIYSL